jgi:hypothetical protein
MGGPQLVNEKMENKTTTIFQKINNLISKADKNVAFIFYSLFFIFKKEDKEVVVIVLVLKFFDDCF